eukprot:CAMPEP_0176077674 /NCGR_PEP_ID=MMETSP0120_2-20121206/38839_1 /TAXON_ID=160619 /ORGANISM="Kryptoperidinium foliaceum, Strain CCMP 1326" /LENGTH=71 /DNA_ID=CAMNT_0017411411 /DNA_START=148 /DNA_END=359 /DNA_ORIENTATION=+
MPRNRLAQQAARREQTSPCTAVCDSGEAKHQRQPRRQIPAVTPTMTHERSCRGPPGHPTLKRVIPGSRNCG